MEQEKKGIKGKGGRPAKAMKRNKALTVKCTHTEGFIIKGKAKEANLTVSEYLRKLGLTSKVVMQIKTLPNEVLALKAALNHIRALLNQIAKKRNGIDELNAMERADLKVLEGRLCDAIDTIHKHTK